jgi:hypothetical protein
MASSEDKTDFVEFDIWDAQHTIELGKFMSIAVEFKHHGKWRIHKNDPDKNFPSDFHADRVDEAEKLNLYTGDVYSKITKQKTGHVKDKQMRKIYTDLERRGESFLDDKLCHKEKFSYLKN